MNTSKTLVKEFTIAGIHENMRFTMKVPKFRLDLPSKVNHVCLPRNETNLFVTRHKRILKTIWQIAIV